MWPRTVEVMLGLWLAMSPFIFSHSPDQPRMWWTDFGAAFLIITVSLASFGHRTSRAHLLNILIALWLVGYSYFAFSESPPPAVQNDLTVGILLLMLAIIPSRATAPPAGWSEISVVATDAGARET